MRWRKLPADGRHAEKEEPDMKVKRAGLLTKIVVLALLIGLSIALLDLRSRLEDAQAQKAALTAQVDAQTQVNADLSDAVENSDDPKRQQDIARDSLGLVLPGEKILRITE